MGHTSQRYKAALKNNVWLATRSPSGETERGEGWTLTERVGTSLRSIFLSGIQYYGTASILL